MALTTGRTLFQFVSIAKKECAPSCPEKSSQHAQCAKAGKAEPIVQQILSRLPDGPCAFTQIFTDIHTHRMPLLLRWPTVFAYLEAVRSTHAHDKAMSTVSTIMIIRMMMMVKKVVLMMITTVRLINKLRKIHMNGRSQNGSITCLTLQRSVRVHSRLCVRLCCKYLKHWAGSSTAGNVRRTH
eukprot:12431528-Karenia_brevis.AAC.1